MSMPCNECEKHGAVYELKVFSYLYELPKRMNSYRFSDVIFVKIRLIFVLYNADTEN